MQNAVYNGKKWINYVPEITDGCCFPSKEKITDMVLNYNLNRKLFGLKYKKIPFRKIFI